MELRKINATMKNDKYNHYKSTQSDFIGIFDDIFGYDLASFWINDDHYHGYLEKSPIEDRLVSKFNYIPINNEAKKPYKAHWMIHESKLLLGYVNGVIDGKELYTDDIVPEYPDDEVLYHYCEYNGILKFCIQGKEISRETKNKIFSCDFLELTFKDGVLLRVDEVM